MYFRLFTNATKESKTNHVFVMITFLNIQTLPKSLIGCHFIVNLFRLGIKFTTVTILVFCQFIIKNCILISVYLLTNIKQNLNLKKNKHTYL